MHTYTRTHMHTCGLDTQSPITWAGCTPTLFMERWVLQGFLITGFLPPNTQPLRTLSAGKPCITDTPFHTLNDLM